MYENGSFAEGYAVGRDVTGEHGYNNGFFGGDWAWIIILFLIFGWGGNGFGNNWGGGAGAANNYVLATDFATIERKLDGVNNGLCSLGYQLQGDLCNGFATTLNAINSNGYETRNAINSLSSQLASCCCDIKTGLLENRYVEAQGFANLSNTICSTTRDIIENQNANYRAIHDELVANKIEAKNDIIAAQQSQINALQLKASQEAQSNYIVTTLSDKLSPCPKPAYLTCNPNAPYPYYNYGFNGFSSGCGCTGVQ